MYLGILQEAFPHLRTNNVAKVRKTETYSVARVVHYPQFNLKFEV